MNRREFVQTTAAAAAMSAIALPSLGLMQKWQPGLQLYSLRDIILTDVKGVMKQVADVGYKELEIYGYKEGMLFGMKAVEFSNYCKSLGMRITSGHFGTDLIFGNWESICDDARAMGLEYVVVPSMDEKYHRTLSELKKTCGLFNKAAETAAKKGLKFNYHNHNAEFKLVEGEIMYDVMLKELDPKLVGMELDIYWITLGGYSAIDYFAKHPGRFPQWHVKDMDKIDKTKNADLGTGSIDFKSIFARASQSGLKHLYIEQETYPVSPMESIKNCMKGLKVLI